MTIKQKIIATTVTFIIFLLVFGTTIHCGYHYVTNKASLANSFDKEAMYLQMMLRGLNEAIINEGTPSSLRTEIAGMEGFDEIHARLITQVEDPDIQRIMTEEIDPKWKVINKDIKPFLEHYVDLNDDELMVKAGELIVKTEYIIEHVNKLAEKTRAVVNTNSKISATVMNAMEIIIPVLLLISIILSCNIYRSINNPIEEITALAEGFNKGDLSIMMDESRKDEFGSLAKFFNKATTKLQKEIVERKQAEEHISHMAYHDSLTGLPNRHLLQDRLNTYIAYANRHQRKVAVIYFDIDDFKRINDTLGHNIGDLLLKRVAHIANRSIRLTDTTSSPMSNDAANSTASRLGGDEFTLLLTDIRTSHDAVIVVQRLVSMLNNPLQLSGNEVYITVSIGITLYPEDGDDADTLLKNADAAMYHAKNQGKNNFQFYQDSMNYVYRKRLTLENELRKAIERNEFVLYYQPRIEVKTENILSAEALIRWQKPDKGLISPAEFIPIAEDMGLILPMGEWVLKTACAQNKTWQESGFSPLCVSVNVSGKQFQQKNFITTVMNALKESALDARYLELEITESVLMNNAQTLIEMLRELKRNGVQLAMDDFGTGYSSFSYLKQFPLDVIKIDKSFIDDITVNSDTETIVAAMITMVNRLNLKTVAEGVETRQQLDILRDNGCDEVQGYYFSKPLCTEDFTALLEKSIHQPLGIV